MLSLDAHTKILEQVVNIQIFVRCFRNTEDLDILISHILWEYLYSDAC